MFLLTTGFMPLFLIAAIYTGFRLFGFVKQFIPKLKKLIFWAVYLFFPISYIVGLYLPVSEVDKLITNIGYLYMGFLIIAMMLVALAEIGRIVLLLLHKIPDKGEQRRKSHIALGLAIILITTVTFSAGLINAAQIDTTEYSIEVKKSCAVGDLKIVEVGDLHLGYQESAAKIKRVVETINAQNPDIVLIVGDLLDGGLDEVFDLTRAEAELSKITAKYGVYACLGNHDICTPAFEEFCSQSGVTLLKDEETLIAESFYIVGRNDRNILTGVREERASLSDIIKDVDQTKPVIVLDHRPEAIEEAVNNGADLLLCGHSHGGQTFPLTIITEQLYEVNYGLEQFQNMTMIVTSGTGLWGPPTRIGTDSEIVVINVKFTG